MDALKTNSIKVNFFLNTFRLVLGAIIPLVIFPYVSRILGPSNIGKVDFANSVVSYFILFASFGVPMYGIREVSQVKDNKKNLSNIVMELTLIELIITFLCYIVYFVFIFFIPRFNNFLFLYLVISPNIILGVLNYEWFYQGIENQIYITIRFIVIRVIQVLSIYLFIKKSSDYIRYAIILVSLNSIGSIFNLINLRNYLEIPDFHSLNLVKHLKPLLIIFISSVATSIYMQLDVTMVGVFVNDKSVGIYVAANKVIRILTLLVTSLGYVMIPRLSNNLANKDFTSYSINLKQSFNFVLFLSLPLTAGVYIFSPLIINLLAGPEYIDSISCMRLLTPIIFTIGMSQFVGHQILYINKREDKYTLAITISAFINFFSNLYLIPRYQAKGACLCTFIAESSVFVLLCVFGRKYIRDACVLSWKSIFFVFSTLLMVLGIFLLKKYLIENEFILIIVAIFLYISSICFFIRFFKIPFLGGVIKK